ncbi:hypothetical protein MUN81_10350 [Hymenobacter sp. 5317J-9]|uniref:hypothetical protein n=1 Tax=unclassified Hymenobacter TaxID=2615202 RepID=UPI0018EE05AD|nr:MULTISPECIES: hypothetical protein [unclassified Hymenobacter]MBJ6109462.1 hypothetical protein [Hymenobacter sp. BT523]UOQ99879.1 hypothetical protein MUN81_10350 [Hymenobacter sp. 5317J-9]
MPKVSLTDARTGKRLRLDALPEGAALVEPILGYCYQAGHFTVYVNGSMPLALRSAQEENRTAGEVWLVKPLPAGIREIDWTDCRRDYQLLLPEESQAA